MKALYSVTMSAENTLLFRISKDAASSIDEAKAKVEEIIMANKVEVLDNENAIIITNDKMSSVKESLNVDDIHHQITLAEEDGNHYKVGATYLVSFYFDMKGRPNNPDSVSSRSVDCLANNSKVNLGAMQADVLATYYNHISATQISVEEQLESEMSY